MAKQTNVEVLLEEALEHKKNGSTSYGITTAVPQLDLYTYAEDYKKISEEMDFIKKSIEVYVQQAGPQIEQIKERERVIRDKVPAKTVANTVRGILGLAPIYQHVEKRVVESYQEKVPALEGTYLDLQRMINEAANHLLERNKGLEKTLVEIEKVTTNMRSLQKEYLSITLKEKQNFDSKDSWLKKAVYAHGELSDTLREMAVTDPRFEASMNNYEDLENSIVQTTYDLKKHHINTVLFMNHKNALRIYEKCLEFSRHTGEHFRNYVAHFGKLAQQLNVSAVNVREVGEHIYNATEITNGMVKHIRKAHEVMGAYLGVVKKAADSSQGTELIDTREVETEIDKNLMATEKQLGYFRSIQLGLDEKIKRDVNKQLPRFGSM